MTLDCLDIFFFFLSIADFFVVVVAFYSLLSCGRNPEKNLQELKV